MKLIHIADLHIGKIVNKFNMIEDQRHILNEIIEIAKEKKVSGIMIAGDVYDKSQPSEGAVKLLDEFLTRLINMNLKVFLISGNHDSAERIGFGNQIFEEKGLHIAGVFNGTIKMVSIEENDLKVNIYLLPFLKPVLVRHFINDLDKPIETYDDAVKTVINDISINEDETNIIVAHQFVTGSGIEPETCDSETVSVGGSDNVDTFAFNQFDYVALGHLHRAQRIGRDTVRYAGSPLKYSDSEANHEKSLTLLTIENNKEINIEEIKLKPLRDLRKIEGPIDEIIEAGRDEQDGEDDYICVTLTDEKKVYDPMGKLREVYPNIMTLRYKVDIDIENLDSKTAASGDVSKKSIIELFEEFFENQNHRKLDEEEKKIMLEICEGMEE